MGLYDYGKVETVVTQVMPWIVGGIILIKFLLNKYRNNGNLPQKDQTNIPKKLENCDLNLLQLSKFNGKDKDNIVIAVNHRCTSRGKLGAVIGIGNFLKNRKLFEKSETF